MVVPPHMQHSLQEGDFGGRRALQGFERVHEGAHLLPVAHVPGCMCCQGRKLPLGRALLSPPLLAHQHAQPLPLCQAGQAPACHWRCQPCRGLRLLARREGQCYRPCRMQANKDRQAGASVLDAEKQFLNSGMQVITQAYSCASPPFQMV